jgi:hypothetical protein
MLWTELYSFLYSIIYSFFSLQSVNKENDDIEKLMSNYDHQQPLHETLQVSAHSFLNTRSGWVRVRYELRLFQSHINSVYVFHDYHLIYVIIENALTMTLQKTYFFTFPHRLEKYSNWAIIKSVTKGLNKSRMSYEKARWTMFSLICLVHNCHSFT